MEIHIKKDISHYNRALGKYITNKRQYNDEMKRQGMVSKEKGDELARKAKERDHKDYKPTREHVQFLASVKNRTDKNGNVKLDGRQLEYMKKIGCQLKRPKERPMEGGWE